MASSPITSWQVDGGQWKQWQSFLGSKITTDSDCSREIERLLLLGRKAMTNLDSLLKNRDIALLTKIHIVKAMVFPVVTYGCKSWTIKQAEHWRNDTVELWFWSRLLRVPWTARSNQSTLKEISPEYSLEGLMLKSFKTLATCFREPTHWKRPCCWERLRTGEEENEMVGLHHQLNRIRVWTNSEIVKDREGWHAAMHGVAKSQTWLSNWRATTIQESLKCNFRSISSCSLVGLNHVCLYWIMKKTL